MDQVTQQPTPLSVDRLRWACEPEALGIKTTDDLPDIDEIIGQGRVVEAIRFGVQMAYPGYNIYALGPPGYGRHTIVNHFLEEQAAAEATPSDWCYVSNFDNAHKPRRLEMPNGRGGVLQHDMDRFIEDCGAALTAAFEGEEYRNRHQAYEEELKERHEEALEDVEREANENGIAMVRTPVGFALAPMKDRQVVSPDVFRTWPQAERAAVEEAMENIQERLRGVLRDLPRWQKETLDKVRELNDETAMFAVGHLIDALKTRYADLPQVAEYLDRVGEDVVANVEAFLQAPAKGGQAAPTLFGDGTAVFRRYRVNLLVDNAEAEHAPVIYEDNPTYDRLVGSIEHRAEMGALVTDFNMIRAGALHRANGGYLVLDARKLLTNPLSWEGLKHALRAGEVRIESMARALGLLSTQTLEPEPIPLKIKVVLVGERLLYYLLNQFEPEFASLFKVAADFEEHIDRSPEQTRLYARLVATLVRRNELLPFDGGGVARVLEHAARLAGDTEKMSAQIEKIGDLLREANFHARKAGRSTVTRQDVESAEKAAVYRADRLHHRVLDEIRRGTLLIDSDDAKVGQVNGLAVTSLSDFTFGRPSRITARIRLGRGEVVDIEREVALGGPLHSKGVLILAGYLSSRYAQDMPLSLSASLVFEQSYGGVEGDSASSAELYALLSAIADVPIKQSFAVTGSVNQAGEVQAIGGVNEKIEGFFDVCAARGLTGEQGVLIPVSNVVHLMLDQRVIEAVAAGKFHIYPVSTIDQGISLLTGVPAGSRGDDGAFPPGSVNARVEARLAELAEQRRRFGETAEEEQRRDD